ncbi:MAG: hypothetical protein ACRDHL_06885 [Candidatus Promineifilaceae bacterium]
MDKYKWLLIAPFGLALLLIPIVPAGPARAQQNPTPIVITLTPPEGQPTAVPSPTSAGAFQPDRLEPNDEVEMATSTGWGTQAGLTLVGADVDYFTSYLKGGQMVRLDTTVYGNLDTRLKLFWHGQLVAENDDRSPTELGSTVTWTAAADGWFVTLVEKVTAADGLYDLEVALVAPAATPTSPPPLTPAPTLTPAPSPTPQALPDLAEPNNTPDTAWPLIPGMRATYTLGAGDVDHFSFLAQAGNTYSCETVAGQVDTLLTVSSGATVIGVNDDRGVRRLDSYLTWMAPEEQAILVKVEARGGGFGPYELVCQTASISGPVAAPAPGTPLATTASMTATHLISLTVRHIGRVPPQPEAAATYVRLLVYYDANNDRSPGPGEGVANVSVLAVDAQGQRIARAFTNAQGEALFNLSSDTLSRVIVPFVPGWSAQVRVGETNEEIVLGLPAVRLPVFLPVQSQPAAEE